MKKVLVSIFIIIFAIAMINSVYAASSGSVTLKLSSTTIKEGDEVTLTVSATDTNNINAVGYTGIKITNKDGEDCTSLFEALIPEKANENISGNLSENGVNYYLMSAGEHQTSDIFKVKIKLASGTVSEGTYNITIDGLVVENKTYALGTSEEKTTNVGTKTAEIKVVKDTTVIGEEIDTTKENETTTTPSTKKTSNSSKSTSSKSSSSSSSKKTLPQTGVEVVSIVGIAVLSIVAIISYVSYRKYKNI